MGSVPFTSAQFFAVMARYNEAVWPAQWAFNLLAFVAVAVAWRGTTSGNGRIVSGILALFWLWVGVVYHFGFFRIINPAAILFAALFILEAVLLVWAGVWRTQLTFQAPQGWSGLAGGLLILYGLVLYPALGSLFGQRYPAIPTFGLPCPTTIFSIGLLLWARRPMPRSVFVMPIIWAAIGSQATVYFGIWEDLGLAVAGVVAVAAMFRKSTTAPTPRSSQ